MLIRGNNLLKYVLIRNCCHATSPSPNSGALQLSTSSNGIKVASYEPVHHIHNSKIGLIFNAGSRYENYDSQGMNHMLRRSIGISAGGLTHIMITRHMQQLGMGFRAIGTRESLAYVSDVSPDALDTCAKLMNAAILENHYFNWELLRFVTPKMLQDIEHLFQNDIYTECNERLHATAFSHGLSNSLYMRKDKTSSFNIEVINDFIRNTHGNHSAIVFGTGVEHEHLKEIADMFPIKHTSTPYTETAVFSAGESRRQLSISHTHVQMAWSIPKGLSDTKSGLTASLLAYCLDPGTTESMTHPEGEYGVLERSGARNAAPNATSSGLLHLYSDSGLMGVAIDTDRNGSQAVVSAVYRYAMDMGKNGVSDEDFTVAKGLLKHKLLRQAQDPEGLLDLCMAQSTNTSNFKLPDELVSELEGITVSDVNKMASQVFSNQMVISSAGDLQNVPYLADLKRL